MSMDYTKPLLVPAGSDALGQIGESPHSLYPVRHLNHLPAGVPSLSSGDLEKISARLLLIISPSRVY